MGDQNIKGLLKTGRARPYIQFGGSRPSNPLLYYGGETNYMAITGVSAPVRGGVSPINMHDPYVVGRYAQPERTIDAPDLPSASLMIRERTGVLPKYLTNAQCLITNYLMHGACRDLSQVDTGWEDYILCLSNGVVTDRDMGDRFTFDSDDPIEATLGLTYEAIYGMGTIAFTERNKTGITLEVMDITYMSQTACGDCGIANDGTKKIYAVEKGGGAAKPIVHYSLDGGATWTTSSISVAANAEAPNAIRVMGQYLVVLSPTANSSTQGGYYYAPLNTITGAVGTWTKVLVGFTNNQKPNDMAVLGPREAYICCDAGEILKLTDIPGGARSLGIFSANNLTRIDASSDAIVAAGASATVLVSINRGQSFAATPTSPGAATQNAVQVVNRNRIWVGDASGVVRYTEDGGNNWVTASLGLTLASVQDIKMATQEAIFVTGLESTTPRLVSSTNAGYSWVNTGQVVPRIVGIESAPTAQRFNRIAVPAVQELSINANYAALAGLGATTDGTIYVGAGNIF